jgi:hypothetical protein
MRKRQLTFFDVRHGYEGDDVVQNMRTVVFLYTFKGQKKRRSFYAKVNETYFNHHKRLLSMQLWQTFKKQLNVVVK